jgi:ABC-type methionine transport system ATPase subunit
MFFVCVIIVARFDWPRYSARMQKTRLWLMFPARLITRPILWELARQFAVVTNIRQASVTDEIGLVSLELDGEREEIKKSIAWLEENGIKVEPVEIGTIAS